MKQFAYILLSLPFVALCGAVMALDHYLRLINGVPTAPPPCECEMPFNPPTDDDVLAGPSCAPGRWN